MNQAKIILLMLFSLFCGTVCFGQTGVSAAKVEQLSAKNSERVYNEDEVSRKPEFVGGVARMYAYLGKHIRYTKEAEKANVAGKLFTRFVVNTDGSISDISILKGFGFGMDEMLIDVISKMPRWKPGELASKPVRTMYNLPVTICGLD
ncbi:energy transducer TonB [Fibrella aquatilis]|uniref:Energy transducer TonB n=1 Tax=Fibrella aquatilis TaxID=2817059 RepID=A0A939G2D1_9BACT|nr:energy transducer TonB [Fibrella aquatilis]MBO0930784.1 energy transducer TonB [Fibrella aquatilis]